MVTKTINVSTAAQLQTALAGATGGETILLSAGNYGVLELTARVKYDITHPSATPVTIRSADATRPAIFTGLDVREASGFSFQNLKFDYTYKSSDELWSRPFEVSGSSNIAIRGCTFDGDVAVNRSADDDGLGFAVGFTASGSKNFTFENNTMYNFYRGATFGNNDNTVVRGNNIHSIRMDGLNFSAVQGVLIENNYIHDFKRSSTADDHADMIQFWTNNTSRPSTDIVIRGNTLDIGKGGNTQSIFMRNDQVDQGFAGTEMFYRNVLIEQNTIYNDHLHGITVGETAGLTIRNNAVMHADGATAGLTGRVSLPTINMSAASTGVTIVNNVTGGLAGDISGSGSVPATWVVSNNLIVQDSDQSAPNHYSELFLSTSIDDTSPAHKFLALPGGLIETLDVGPDIFRIDGAPARITPLFHVATLPADDKVFVFDAASYTFGPLGAITPDIGTFVWDFGDGSTGTGGVVAHRYAGPGNYSVKVSVVPLSGTTVSTSDIVVSVHPDLLRLDTTTGSFGIVIDDKESLFAISTTALVGTKGAWALDLGKSGVTASVNRKQIEDLFGSDNFALDLQLKADLKSQSYGEVFRLHEVFVASVDSAGKFVFQLFPSKGASITLTSTGPNLLDGLSHKVSIRFDADEGYLKLSVDGKTTVTAPITVDMKAMGTADLVFGNPWSKKNFDGPLQKFDLNVERSHYSEYTGTEIPVDSNAPVMAVRMVNLAAPEPMSDLSGPAANLADAAPPDAGTLDDHLLDGAAMGRLRAAALHGDTHLAVRDGRTVLAFDGKGDQAVIGRLNDFATSDRLAISVEFQRDVADGSSGRLIANPGQILLAVDGDGFRLNVATAEAGMKLFKLGSLGLKDTEVHKAMVIVDTVADRLQVFLDNQIVLDDEAHDFVMVNPGGTGRGWIAGTGFDGQIAEIRIDDDIAPLLLQHPVSNDALAFV